MIHIILHFLIPLIIAKKAFNQSSYLFFSTKNIKFPIWIISWIAMMLTMIVDLDHLLATPIYQMNRCSIGFHPFHGLLPILLYGIACIPHKTRIFAVGLIIHMILDSIDCKMNTGVWYV